MKDNFIIFCYVDDCNILSRKCNMVADQLDTSLKNDPENFILKMKDL